MNSLKKDGEIVCVSPLSDKMVINVCSSKRDDKEGISVFVESIGREIWEPIVDFDVVDVIFAEYGLIPYDLDFLSSDNDRMFNDVSPRLLFSEVVSNEMSSKSYKDFYRFSAANCLVAYRLLSL